MVGDGNFWDEVPIDAESTTVQEKVPSSDPSVSIETPVPFSEQNPQSSVDDVSGGFIPHEPREIISSVIAQTCIAIFVGGILFVAIGFGFVGEVFEVFPMECDGELIETEDGTYMCLVTDFRSNAEYDFFENSTVSVTELDDYYFSDTFRWEHSDNVSMIGYYELDWMKWSSWQNCQWEGGSYAGDTRWYCISTEDGYEDYGEAFAYCEYSTSEWLCTDEYRISESNRNSSSEKSHINDFTYLCYKAILLSDLNNQSFSELEDGMLQLSYPTWCYDDAVLSSEINSNDTQLPFEGEAFLTFYNHMGFDIKSASIMQYSSSGLTMSSFQYGVYDSNGEQIVDASLQMAGGAIIAFMGVFYLLIVYAAYTKKTYVAHLGSENTVVIKSSWFNKPAREISRVQLMPTSYVLESVTYSTDSDGNSTSSTHYEIYTPGQSSLNLPGCFSEEQLAEVTGLVVR